MKHLILYSVFLLGLIAVGCQAATPTPGKATPFPTEIIYATPVALPTYTPAPLNDPELLQVKQLLKKGFEQQDSNALAQTISFSKFVASIYRVGGTPPIDPPRGLNLSMEFAKENKLVVDLARPTYEPRWSIPAGDTSVLVYVTPADGDPYYAHLYVQHEPSAWRFTGILSHIPYYDAPMVSQVLADPAHYNGKEYMYVGVYATKAKPPTNAGAPPPNAAFVLNTFSGPLWVVMLDKPYVGMPPPDADSRAGQLVRLFGTVKLYNGVPFIESDSVKFIEPDSWAHVQGTIDTVNSEARRVNLKTTGQGPTSLQLAETSFISTLNGTRGSMADLKPGLTVDATGMPQPDGTLVIEELFIGR